MRSSSKSAAAAAAAPASLTSPKPSASKRQRKATAPLGDVTNLFVPADTPTPSPSKPRRTASMRGSLPAHSDVSAVSSACSSSASVTPAPKPSATAAFVTPARKAPSPAAACVVTPAPKPKPAVSFVSPARNPSRSPAAASVTPTPKPSSSAAAAIQEDRGALKSPPIARVYRRTPVASSKGNEPVTATASCRPPHGRSARTQSRKRLISASAPCHEGKKKRPITSTPNLLEGLLEKQRAYFADIDAFELVEEVVSESELE